MNHLTQEEIVDAFYDDLTESRREHLNGCLECRDALANLSELLSAVRETPVPARGEGYGREIWARLQPKLAPRKLRWWTRPWVFTPLAAGLLVAAFLSGMFIMHVRDSFRGQPSALSETDRQRVLLSAISDHLDRSEILLAQLLHATPSELNSAGERSRARDLLDESRLLRETATRSGDRAHAALLDDLERVLLDIANSPAQLSPQDVAELRRRVEDQGLLFKVRVTSSDARAKGRTL